MHKPSIAKIYAIMLNLIKVRNVTLKFRQQFTFELVKFLLFMNHDGDVCPEKVTFLRENIKWLAAGNIILISCFLFFN